MLQGALLSCRAITVPSAMRSARLSFDLIGSPINYANRSILSPITSQSTDRALAPRGLHSTAEGCPASYSASCKMPMPFWLSLTMTGMLCRSGKIMRRLLRKVAVLEDDKLGDTSTLADPSVVETLIDMRGK